MIKTTKEEMGFQIMRDIFNLDGGLMGFLSRLTDLLILNLIFILTCIPIITIGPALTALYSITLKMVKNEESYIFKSYFLALKANFKISFFAWLVLGIVSLITAFNYRIALQFNTMRNVFLVIFLMVSFLCALLWLFLFPYIARFENTLKQSFKNAFFMAIASLPYTFLLLLITILFIALLFFIIPLQYALLLCLSFGFSTLAFVQSFVFRKIFAKYEPKDDTSLDS